MINAYKDLYGKFQAIKRLLNNKIEHSNDLLESIKSTICQVEIPELPSKGTWRNISNLLEVLNNQKLRIQEYVKDFDCSDEGLKANPILLDIKVVEHLLKRYLQDIDSFFRYSMNDFFYISIDDSEYPICKDIFLDYKDQSRSYKEILKEIASNMKNPEYIVQHDIPTDVAETLLTGAIDKLDYLGENTSEFLDFDL